MRWDTDTRIQDLSRNIEDNNHVVIQESVRLVRTKEEGKFYVSLARCEMVLN
jgi:hypothetical protein